MIFAPFAGRHNGKLAYSVIRTVPCTMNKAKIRSIETYKKYFFTILCPT